MLHCGLSQQLANVFPLMMSSSGFTWILTRNSLRMFSDADLNNTAAKYWICGSCHWRCYALSFVDNPSLKFDHGYPADTMRNITW
ncbi:hypothetical protein Glove_228g93 [Diversispora epigaea]|uniref:Uncharacterized protein n=1 Tax=Diversispora epigaea TaxID=1348612 RepID=A0A397IMC3_9GLOM|nr:hypothetical protein Glove_228g93 [Diversispora epigaea]